MDLERFLSDSPSAVGIICRFYEGSLSDVITLAGNLLSQEKLPEPIVLGLVPTEFVGKDRLDALMQLLWTMTRSKLTRARVFPLLLSPPSSLYSELRESTRALCTEEFQQQYMEHWGTAEHMHRYCSINSYLHYYVTDVAYSELVTACDACKYMLFTNADNLYAPDFLNSAIGAMSQQNSDLVVSSFVHRKEPLDAQVVVGKMDLGGVLVDRSLLDSSGMTFFKAVGDVLTPQNLHDADYWFVKSLQDMGAKIAFMTSFGFMHN